MNSSLSILIVVKDAKEGLHKTLQSIRRNSKELLHANAEIVIIDGRSTDGSWSLATKTQQITGIKTTFYQQPPLGIYSAMNMAQYKSEGNWLVYINAGDIFHDCTNIGEILEKTKKQAIQFKSAIKRPEGRNAYAKIGQWDSCHQALIYRKECHKEFGDYNEVLKICSDSLFIKNFKDTEIEYVDQILSITQVSPKNASRDPQLVRKDINSIRQQQIDHQPWKQPWLTLATLQIEAATGSSLTVWMKCHLGRALSKHKKVRIDPR